MSANATEWLSVTPDGPHLHVDVVPSKLPYAGEIEVNVHITGGRTCTARFTAHWANPERKIVPVVPYPGQSFIHAAYGEPVVVHGWEAYLRSER